MTIHPILVYSNPYTEQKKTATPVTNVTRIISKGLKKYRLNLADPAFVDPSRKDSTIGNIAISRLSAKASVADKVPKLSWFKRIFYVPLKVQYEDQTFWVAANKRSLKWRLQIEKKELNNAKTQPDLQALVQQQIDIFR